MNINIYNPYVRRELELYHHGVLGQEWGKRNGPPYPLNRGAHSAKEKKAGWQKSLNKSSGSKYGNNSSKANAGMFIAKMALDVVGLNPIGLVRDTKRLVDYTRSKALSSSENKRLANSKIDEKTGLRLKQKEFTPEEDMRVINPDYKNFNNNTKNNCMLCTTAYEMRRRGYDVRAGYESKGLGSSAVQKWFPDSKLEHAYSLSQDRKERSKQLVNAALGVGGKEKYDDLSKALLKHGDGARGNLLVTWDGLSGHSVVWENQNGGFVIRDCQSNKTYTSRRQIEKLLKITATADYVRTDNVDFDPKTIKEAIR